MTSGLQSYDLFSFCICYFLFAICNLSRTRFPNLKSILQQLYLLYCFFLEHTEHSATGLEIVRQGLQLLAASAVCTMFPWHSKFNPWLHRFLYPYFLWVYFWFKKRLFRKTFLLGLDPRPLFLLYIFKSKSRFSPNDVCLNVLVKP